MKYDVDVVSSEKPARTRRRIPFGRIPKWIFVWAILIGSAFIFGTPYLRIQYQGRGAGGEITMWDRCDYFGLQGWKMFVPPGVDESCPLFKLFPLQIGTR